MSAWLWLVSLRVHHSALEENEIVAAVVDYEDKGMGECDGGGGCSHSRDASYGVGRCFRSSFRYHDLRRIDLSVLQCADLCALTFPEYFVIPATNISLIPINIIL